jgi:hypothetical protein
MSSAASAARAARADAKAHQEMVKAEQAEHKLRIKEEKEFAKAEAKRQSALEKLRKKMRNAAARNLVNAEKAAQRAETKHAEANIKFEAKRPFPRAKDGGESKQELRAKLILERADVNLEKAQELVRQRRAEILAVEREIADPGWEEHFALVDF